MFGVKLDERIGLMLYWQRKFKKKFLFKFKFTQPRAGWMSIGYERRFLPETTESSFLSRNSPTDPWRGQWSPGAAYSLAPTAPTSPRAVSAYSQLRAAFHATVQQLPRRQLKRRKLTTAQRWEMKYVKGLPVLASASQSSLCWASIDLCALSPLAAASSIISCVFFSSAISVL